MVPGASLEYSLGAGSDFATFDATTKVVSITPSNADADLQKEVRVDVGGVANCPVVSSSFFIDFLPACSITTYGPSTTPDEFLPATAVLEIGQTISRNFKFVMEPDCPFYSKTYTYFINDVETTEADLPAWLSLDQSQEHVTFYTTDTSLVGASLSLKVQQNLNKIPIADWTT